MITLLHGDNQVRSRQRFIDIREDYVRRGFEIVALDGKTTTIGEIILAEETSNLLGQGRTVFVEDFFVKKKVVPKEVNKLSGEVVFWEPSELPRQPLGGLPKGWKIELFTIPNLVFKFLDSLSPDKAQANISFFHRVVDDKSSEMLLPLLAWHTRQLIWAKEEPEILVVPPWKKQKLLSQAKNFTKEQLYSLHNKLINLDRDVKTGASPLPLDSSLDLVIATL